jgi:hypothetical protein
MQVARVHRASVVASSPARRSAWPVAPISVKRRCASRSSRSRPLVVAALACELGELDVG